MYTLVVAATTNLNLTNKLFYINIVSLQNDLPQEKPTQKFKPLTWHERPSMQVIKLGFLLHCQ